MKVVAPKISELEVRASCADEAKRIALDAVAMGVGVQYWGGLHVADCDIVK